MYSFSMLALSFVFFILLYIPIVFGSVSKKLTYISYFSMFFYLFYLLIIFYNKPIVGGDSLEYLNRYESGLEYYSIEVLFGLLDSTFKYFDTPSLIYISLLSIICIISQLLVIFFIGYRNIAASFFLFMTNSFAILTWSGVYKQGVSVAFVLLSAYLLMLNKKRYSYFFIVLAIFIHNSALLILVTFLFYELLKSRYLLLKLICLFSYFIILINFFFDLSPLRVLIQFVAKDLILPITPSEFSRGVRYFIVDFSKFNAESFEYLKATSRVSVDIFFQYSFFAFLFFSKNINKTKESWFWALLYVISCLFYIGSIGQAFSYRFYIFSSFLYVCFLYYIYISCNYKQKGVIALISFFIYLTCSYYSFPPEKIGLLYINPLL